MCLFGQIIVQGKNGSIHVCLQVLPVPKERPKSIRNAHHKVAMRHFEHSLAKAMRPLVSIALSTAGTNTAIAAKTLEDELITVLTEIDKATTLMPISGKGLRNSFLLIIGYGMRKGIILPVLREDLLHRNQRIIIKV